jgi:hypothetical protein
MTAALPVWATTKAIIAYCWRERSLAIKYAGLPVATLLLMECAGIVAGIDTNKSMSWQLGTTMVSLLLYSPFIVTWFQAVIAGDSHARSRPLLAYTPLERNVILINIQIAFFLIIVTIVLGLVLGLALYVCSLMGPVATRIGAVVLGLPAIFVWFLILTRVSLALAYAAAGEPISMKRAFDISAPVGMSMTLVHVILALASGVPVVLVTVLWELLPEGSARIWPDVGRAIISIGFGMLYLLFATTLFGVVYRHLKGERAR